jgi:amino acid transporter
LVLFTKLALQQTSQNMIEDLEEIDLKLFDKDDFMSEGQNKLSVRYPYKAMTLTIIFSGFPYLLIFSLFIYSMSNDGDDIAELISVAYLCFGLTYILHFRSVYRRNLSYLKPLRVFNFFITALTLVFQMPILKCPYSLNDDKFITNKKCSEISMEDHSKTSSSTYSMIMKSLGINKIDNDIQLGLIILIIITEI